MDEAQEEELEMKRQSVAPVKRRVPKKIIIPRRQPSVIIPRREITYITADKLTCAKCPCFPKDPYVRHKKLLPCLRSPPTLYELAVAVLDSIPLPDAFLLSVEDVMTWMSEDVGLPQYTECILDNYIDGMRLMMLEDPSKLPPINIHYFEHIQMITSKVRKLYSTDFVRFCRSIGLPPRKLSTHCTWFKSRTGPSWGIRKNWTRGDILRWMKIILPAPVYRDHWDLVWYHKPDFPKVMFARVPNDHRTEFIPHYKKVKEVSNEFMVPRKFRIQRGISELQQFIWMEKIPVPKMIDEETVVKKTKKTRLTPKKISLEGLRGVAFLLAKRKMPKPKFAPGAI